MHSKRLIASLALAMLPARAGAQWTATITSMAEPFLGGGTRPSAWLWEDIGVRRAVGHTSVGVDGIAARRFDRWDQAIAGEIYTGVTSTSYVNFRAQLTPNAKVLPTSDLSGEFFQSFSQGWEASVGARRMNFDSSGTTIGSLGVGRSFGYNYVRARWIALIRSGGGTVSAAALTARRYGASAENYVEGALTTGSEVVSVGANQLYDIRTTNAVYVRAQRFTSTRFGWAGLLSYAKQANIAARAGVSLSAMVRW